MPFLLSNRNVFDYLIKVGLCSPENQSMSKVELKPAKNFNLLLTLPDNRQVLVKQEPHNGQQKTAGEFLQEWKFQNLLQNFSELSHLRCSCSQAICFDVENSIIIFDYFQDYQDLAAFYTSMNIFPEVIPRAIGAIIASIHRLTLDRQDYREIIKSNGGVFSNHAFEMINGFKQLTPEIFGRFPNDGLKFFTLYQRYSILEQAITNLSDAIAPCCLIHNDLKLNNILLANHWEELATQPSHSMIRLIDWEKSNWGDPASDLGTLIAGYLQIWLYSLITSKTIPITESLQLATTPLELLQPSMASLIHGYLGSFPDILQRRSDFLIRVVQFSGLALMQTILSMLQYEKTFGNAEICILQVAKTLLCRPESSIKTIFGVTAPELIQ